MSAQPAPPPPGVVTGAITIRIDTPEDGSDRSGYYQLAAPNGVEGKVTEWGLPATVTVNGLTYAAFLDEDGEQDEGIGEGVYLLAQVESEEEEVDFEIEDEETGVEDVGTGKEE